MGLSPVDFIAAGLAGVKRTPGTAAFAAEQGYARFPPSAVDDPGPMYISRPGCHTLANSKVYRFKDSQNVWFVKTYLHPSVSSAPPSSRGGLDRWWYHPTPRMEKASHTAGTGLDAC